MKKRGLSLLELVVTASLVTMIFVLMMNIFPSGMVAMRQADHRLAAQAKCRELLDFCQAGGFAPLATDGTYTPEEPGFLAGHLEPVVLDDQVVLRPTVTVSAAPPPAGQPPAPRGNLALVTVKVEWRERGRLLQVVQELRVSRIRR
ncbi:MAG TPA: hypothetical protein VNO81_02165 [Candidatus Nitrosotenuis sp.]|nr:hypothetical protein [Candidatus Nitrosotenuis sp.]